MPQNIAVTVLVFEIRRIEDDAFLDLNFSLF